MKKQIELPISIEVENGEVIAVWYDDEDGIDCLLSEGLEYSVSYRTISQEDKQNRKEHDGEINWLKPKLYTPKEDKKKGDEK